MGLFKDNAEAIQAADARGDAARLPPLRQRPGPTTVHDKGSNSTTVIKGDHHGVIGGVHHGDIIYRF
ncbi:hypothetical protein [Streptomyces sp. AC550_RSS872]|uniref:hypothetical protein n=1 Tax=Streptomyces sp. AC550_RSS872 TaxID=2823689 RepID=UPI001C26F17E|nr:hypothetical protein [Streptomyces sp. AC550_RSS872]